MSAIERLRYKIKEKGVGRIILSEHEDIDKLMKKFKI